MKKKEITALSVGLISLTLFVLWTALIKLVDVQSIGPKGTSIGFASLNGWFHNLTGVNMTIYNITDRMGLIPVLVCMIFAITGFVQLVKRRSLLKVDLDILILGIYYIAVILCYVIFEIIPVNYRPILINGYLEASYPSSTTLLALSVMPTLIEQLERRMKNALTRRVIDTVAVLISAFMIVGRMICGVHWFTDIMGSVLLSGGLYCIYKALVMIALRKGLGGKTVGI